jgi:AcrR family transcriptional regulator
VSDVARAAEVSQMTVYRHFPTKEDLVLSDEYEQDDAGQSPGDLLLARLRLVLTTPALRARRWDGQYATQQAIVEALRGDPPDPEWEFRLRVAAGACLAAMSAALLRWAEEDGRPDLPRLMAQALAIVSEGQC